MCYLVGMLIPILLLIVGFVGLYFGAEWLVKGSSSLARATGIRPVIIALTIVAFGTSAPEFVVSFSASLHQTANFAVGTIIGSVIANIGLILGISALIRPIHIEFRLLKKEIPIMLFCEGLFLLFAWNLKLGRIEGGILFAGFILFNWYCIREAKRNIQAEKERVKKEYDEYVERRRSRKGFNILFIILGLVALVGGSQLVIRGAITLATIFEISPFIIAASIVAFGTSLPELATSAIATYRKEFDISVGNVLGSNIFNILMCIGGAALATPLIVEPSVVRIDALIMVGFSLLLSLFMWTRRRIGRLEGVILLLAYVAYMTYLYTQ